MAAGADALASAKSALAESYKHFGRPPVQKQASPGPGDYATARAARKTPTLGDELKAKSDNVQQYKDATQ